MPISGLVVVLNANDAPHDETISRLADHPLIEVGEVSSHRVAIVVDTESKEDDQEIWQWVQELPGVVGINIAFVGFENEDEDSEMKTKECH